MDTNKPNREQSVPARRTLDSDPGDTVDRRSVLASASVPLVALVSGCAETMSELNTSTSEYSPTMVKATPDMPWHIDAEVRTHTSLLGFSKTIELQITLKEGIGPADVTFVPRTIEGDEKVFDLESGETKSLEVRPDTWTVTVDPEDGIRAVYELVISEE